MTEVIRQAFAPHSHRPHTAYLLVAILRRAGVLSVSWVTPYRRCVVAPIAFTPVTISDGSLDAGYGLRPTWQGRGIGQALVRGPDPVTPTGRPRRRGPGEPAFYGRFGFASDPALLLEGVPPEYFLVLPLGTARARGRVRYHPAFAVGS